MSLASEGWSSGWVAGEDGDRLGAGAIAFVEEHLLEAVPVIEFAAGREEEPVQSGRLQQVRHELCCVVRPFGGQRQVLRVAADSDVEVCSELPTVLSCHALA